MFDLYELINRHIIFPFYYWKSGDKRMHRLKQLEKNQYLPIDQLETLQLKKLQKIVTYAYQNTEYYRRVMDERGISPEDIQQLIDIEKLPLLTKKDIQNNADQLISQQYKKSELIEDASGGSTGKPTVYFKDLDRHNLRRADQLRHDRWSGWDIGKRSALIWGAARDLKAVKSIREYIISRFIARTWELDAFEMSSERMDEFVVELERIKPIMVLGYANALHKFAQHILKHHPEHKIKLSGIISSAETLTQDKRTVIEQAFHCKVLNRYGSREVGLIASECKQQSGLHINADNVYLEVTQNEKAVSKGLQGDVVVTDFHNKGMPLIRYKLEDVGIMSTSGCSCDIQLPLLASIEGRCSDFFIGKSGKLVHGEYFTHLFYGQEEIEQFQLIQHSLGRIELKIVTKEQTSIAEFISKIINNIQDILEIPVSVEVSYLDSIPPTPTGKHLFTISKVN